MKKAYIGIDAHKDNNFRLPDLDGVLVDFAEMALALFGGATSKGTWRIL